MKKIIAIIALFASFAATAQNERYIAAMKKNLGQFDSVKTTLQYQSLAASFERIGDAEKTEWLPYYYAGLALLNPGWEDSKIDKDANGNRVKALCDKADALAKDNAAKAEILSLRNMAATQQMLVDPQGRFMSYGQESDRYLKKAMELDPTNPRLYYLQGAGIFGSPEAFGGGKAKAKPVLEKSAELFSKAAPKPLYPSWGKKQTEEMLAQCQ